MLLNALRSRMLPVILLGALFPAANAADPAQTWRADQAVKQNAWSTYESEKKQAWAAYEMERRQIWAKYHAERARISKDYVSERQQISKASREERHRIRESYKASRRSQYDAAAAEYAKEAYRKATHLGHEAYAKAAAQSQQAYRNAAKQSRDAYACYAAKAKRAYAAYLATTDRNQEDNLKQMEAEVANKCRALPPSPQLTCNAPAQSGLEVPDGNPTCEQQWGYHIAKILVARHFSEMSRLLDAREQGIIREDDMCDKILSFSGAFLSIFPTQDQALRIIKGYFEIQKLLPAALGSADQEIGTILSEATIEAAKQAALEALTGAVQPKVTIPIRVLKLINDSSTTWAVYNITKERHRLLVAQEYLLDYYKHGGNRSRVAEKYKLVKNASLDEIIAAIAKAYVGSSWISRKMWVPSDTVRTADHYEALVRQMIMHCIEGQCGYTVSPKRQRKPPIACFFK